MKEGGVKEGGGEGGEKWMGEVIEEGRKIIEFIYNNGFNNIDQLALAQHFGMCGTGGIISFQLVG